MEHERTALCGPKWRPSDEREAERARQWLSDTVAVTASLQ